MLIADGWQQRYRLPPDAIKGALALSGLYDLRPLCDIYINDWLHLTPEQAQTLSPLFLLPEKDHAPQILLDVGQRETQGFKTRRRPIMTPAWRAASTFNCWPIATAITLRWSTNWPMRKARCSGR